MQLKNSLLLLTALTAGSSVARMHGHERRHHHHEKRNAGDEVYAVIDGVLQSWVNDWSGSATAAVEEKKAAATVAASATVEVSANVGASATAVASAAATASSSASSSDSVVSSADGTCKSWSATSSSYSRAGFGAKSNAKRTTDAIYYAGNVGSPWGSNIIEVSEDKACLYQYVVRFEGSSEDDWIVKFWNKVGPNGGLNGWYGNSALTFKIKAGETRYVAFDSDSQGGWGASKGDTLPTDEFGGYSCTWGEFDFGNTSNNGWSGWDVSAIQAQNAGHEVQGMRICEHTGDKCSTITNALGSVINAYTSNLADEDGIGGNSNAESVRLTVDLDYN
ncbi:allergen Asp F4 [Aspergillus homomorphus CBS 101889]|uniref:Allergen Asp f 4 n=1 Tax=Aspergillus homomorphus (strain CBS 101889) TaxID=1450537 RepID=A0A395HUU8_ASPHC|nr:allergen Asp f 4 [Aspergillus homomorphus CBS 101889]RAL11299.1 allergen Asp f 4 [Aspergillus homomorphus CBS 101889]